MGYGNGGSDMDGGYEAYCADQQRGEAPEVESCADCDMEGLVPVTGHDGEPRCVWCRCQVGEALRQQETEPRYVSLQAGFYELMDEGVMR